RERLHLLRVEAALASGEALHDDPCCRVEEDAHASPPRSPGRSGAAAAGVGTPALGRFTIFLAASRALASGSMPVFCWILRPSSPPARRPMPRLLTQMPAPFPLIQSSPSSDTYVRPRFLASTS